MNILNMDKTPGATGSYSQGYEVNGVVYTSEQIPVNPADGTMAEGIAAQVEQGCKNAGTILGAAGAGLDRVFKATCSLTDTNDFDIFNEMYAKYFVSKSAGSCVAVKTLPKDVLCGIGVITVK